MDLNYLFERCHREYRRNREVWERSLAAYSGGSAYVQQALIKHVSEIDLEFEERLRRAYYFNYPRKIAALITQYIFASNPVRENADPELVEDFSREGLRANEVMRQFSTMINVFGAAWLLVEMPDFSGSVDMERKRIERLRPCCRALSPLAVRDWSVGRDGKLEWALLNVPCFDNRDPFHPPLVQIQRKLWTRDRWLLMASDGCRVRTVAEGSNPLGEVPLVKMQESGSGIEEAGHWFADAVRISDAIMNNESEAQMNVVKQLFGLLVISETFARQGKCRDSRESGGENGKFSHVLARSAAIYETPEERGISRYISPSGFETARIRDENSKLKAELFDVVGLTLRPESKIRQTAEAKSWDHQNTRQFLSNRVDMLEQAELKAWNMMHGLDRTVPVPEVTYNRDFSVSDLKGMIAGLLDLNKLSDSPEFGREVSRTAVDLLERYRKIEPERRAAIMEEIERSCGGAHE